MFFRLFCRSKGFSLLYRLVISQDGRFITAYWLLGLDGWERGYLIFYFIFTSLWSVVILEETFFLFDLIEPWPSCILEVVVVEAVPVLDAGCHVGFVCGLKLAVEHVDDSVEKSVFSLSRQPGVSFLLTQHILALIFMFFLWDSIWFLTENRWRLRLAIDWALILSHFLDEGELVDKDNEDMFEIIDVEEDVWLHEFKAATDDIHLYLKHLR